MIDHREIDSSPGSCSIVNILSDYSRRTIHSPALRLADEGCTIMINTRAVAILAIGIACSAQALHGQDGFRYRDFQLGATLSSVASLGKVAVSDVKTIHQRPALMQELEWRPPYVGSSSTSAQDPVKQILFSFYEDQLSKIVVDYDHDRTFGMTSTDMIDAISATYGPPLKTTTVAPRPDASRVDLESGAPIARWGDASASVVLYRAPSPYRTSASQFRLVISSPRLTALAATADARATQMDEREAPAREIARQKQEAADTRDAEEKARVANVAAFRP